MKFTDLFKSKWLYIILVIVVASGGYVAFGRNTKPEFETLEIKAGNISQVVSETGIVQPTEDIALSFGRSGRVSQVMASKGDEVTTGQVLATLDSSGLNAELRQAAAALQREKIILDDLFSGPTAEDIALTENSRSLAQANFQTAKTALITAINSAYIATDDAVKSKADQLFSNPDSSSPGFGVTITQGNTTYNISGNSAERQTINTLRRQVGQDLADLSKLTSTEIKDVSTAIAQTEKTLTSAQSLFNNMALVINGYLADTTTVQVIYDGYKLDISSARSSVSASLAAINSAKQAYSTAQVALNTPQAELDFKTAGPTENAIKLQEIRVEEASARLSAVAAQVADAKIISPIDGVITNRTVNPGENASLSNPAFTVISKDALEISVHIPEDDIQFITVDDKALVTFDAFRDLELAARVIYVADKAEDIEGVATIEVKLLFTEQSEQIKSGLSVDVDIITQEKSNVITIPNRSVTDGDDGPYVKILTGELTYKKRLVKLGIRGEGGLVEVLKGLNPGETIISFISEEALAAFSEQ